MGITSFTNRMEIITIIREDSVIDRHYVKQERSTPQGIGPGEAEA